MLSCFAPTVFFVIHTIVKVTKLFQKFPQRILGGFLNDDYNLLKFIIIIITFFFFFFLADTGKIDLFHNGGILIYSILCMIISLFDLV